MSKAVMLSIQPKWCELIASGKKTIEVRKNRPQIETPFKCYIYETKAKGKQSYFNVYHENTIGKVVVDMTSMRAIALATDINHLKDLFKVGDM